MMQKIDHFITQPLGRASHQITQSKITKWIITAAVFILFFLYRGQIAELVSLVRDREGLITYLDRYGPMGPILLGLVIMLQVVVAAIPGHLLMVAGGYVYGFTGGFLLSYLTTIIASQFTFYLARVYGLAVVKKLVNQKDLNKWEKIAARQGFNFFLMTFLIPIFPADVMPYLAGLGKIKGRSFAAANLIGRIPVAVLMTLVGSHGLEVNLQTMVFAVLVSVMLFLLVREYGKRVESKYVQDSVEE